MKRELLNQLLASALLAAAAAAALVFSVPPLAVVLCLAGALAVLNMAFTVVRYRKISQLTADLREVSSGRDRLHLEEYEEGELSILSSEIYKLTVQLREQASLLQEDKLFLERNLSDISHQLKTPLTSLSVMNDLLRDENLPEDKRREFLDNTGRQLERMDWLLSSLLKMAKLDAGTERLQHEPVSALQTATAAAEHLLIPMELRGQQFTVSGDDGAFLGDAAWTREALANILKNCMEHTPQGGRISVHVERTPLYLAMRISDTGCGIDPSDLPHVFERFYHGKNSGEDSVGIGLYMAKSIITRENGTLSVESTLGEGTLFTIKFYDFVREGRQAVQACPDDPSAAER